MVDADRRPTAAGTDSQTSDPMDALWPKIVAELPEMTEALVRRAKHVRWTDDGSLEVTFAASNDLSRRRCEAESHRTALQESVRKVVGKDCRIEMVSEKAVNQPVKRENPAVLRRDRRRQAEGHPLVRSVVEAFEAEIVKVDSPPPKSR